MNGHEEHHYPCVWPECPRSYDPCDGPEEDGWVRLFAGHLCPDHTNTGHTPQRFEWERGTPTLAMSCECGERVEELSPTTRARCVKWWREHVRSVVDQHDELAGQYADEIRLAWREFRSGHGQYTSAIAAAFIVGGEVAARAATTQRAGYARIDDTAVERMAYAMAREHWSQTCVDGEEWNEREHWQVPSLVYMAQARAALGVLTKHNQEEN